MWIFDFHVPAKAQSKAGYCLLRPPQPDRFHYKCRWRSKMPHYGALPHFRCRRSKQTMNLVDSQRLHSEGALSDSAKTSSSARSATAARGAGCRRCRPHWDHLSLAAVSAILPKVPARIVANTQPLSASGCRSSMAGLRRDALHPYTAHEVRQPKMHPADFR